MAGEMTLRGAGKFYSLHRYCQFAVLGLLFDKLQIK